MYNRGLFCNGMCLNHPGHSRDEPGRGQREGGALNDLPPLTQSNCIPAGIPPNKCSTNHVEWNGTGGTDTMKKRLSLHHAQHCLFTAVLVCLFKAVLFTAADKLCVAAVFWNVL